MNKKELHPEIERFLAESAGADTAAAAAGRRVAELFALEAELAPAAAKRRVLAKLSGGEERSRGPLAALRALAYCAAAFLAFALAGPRPAAPAAEQADWRSYDNFPYYADEARMYLEGLSPDWRSPQGLQPDPRTGL